MTHEPSWAGGIFDGEGSTGVVQPRRPNGHQWLRLKMSMGQTDRFVLDRFHRAIGGLGKVYGPYDYGTTRHPQWLWMVGHRDVVAVLNILWPHLSPQKQVQATVALIECAASRA